MKYSWIKWITFFNLIFIVQAYPAPILGSNATTTETPLVMKSEEQEEYCSEEDILWWNINFHNCLIDKKYGDGGRDLNSIIDRILDHAEACTEIANQNCFPNDQGFSLIIEKIIQQMKDYAELYLELILKERHKIKDLECMEKILLPYSYQKCFARLFNHSEPDAIRSSAEAGISCVNAENARCSSQAKTSLNRIVRRILRAKEPEMEDFPPEVSTKPPEKEHFSTVEPAPIHRQTYFSSDEPAKPRARAKPAEEEWHWYDYVAYPFVEAWKAIRNWFGF